MQAQMQINESSSCSEDTGITAVLFKASNSAPDVSLILVLSSNLTFTESQGRKLGGGLFRFIISVTILLQQAMEQSPEGAERTSSLEMLKTNLENKYLINKIAGNNLAPPREGLKALSGKRTWE